MIAVFLGMTLEMDEHRMAEARAVMVEEQIASRGIKSSRVLEAMRRVPRHRFIPEELLLQAHEDYPLPIGRGQTISQPYIVAFMAEVLTLRGHERVLEVGSGSGYMAAVLSHLAQEVYGVELEPGLYDRSRKLLSELNYANIHLLQGDGRMGWPEMAPFDAVLLSCASPEIPGRLWQQVGENGCLLLPLGFEHSVQVLVKFTRTPEGPRREDLLAVSFVPLR